MITNQIPAIEVGNLVIFTPNNGHGHHDIVTKQEEADIKIYDFLLNQTFTLPKASAVPFRQEDYVAMCKQSFRQGLWHGVIVRFPNQKTGVVVSGRMDVFDQDCELVIEAHDGQTYQWVPLSWFKTIGHINAT